MEQGWLRVGWPWDGLAFGVEQAFNCVRENPVFKRAVERNCWIPAAKRREIAARGASPGWKWETSKPRRGERQVLTLALQGLQMRGESCEGLQPVVLPAATEVPQWPKSSVQFTWNAGPKGAPPRRIRR
jgi:hypothetical protein